MTRHYSLRLDLLDEQLVDGDELPFGRVEDLEVSLHADGEPPTIDALLTGMQAYGERIGGMLGSVAAATASRLRVVGEGPVSIPCERITKVDEHVHVADRLEDMPHVAGLEHWLAAHVIEAIPGSGDESD